MIAWTGVLSTHLQFVLPIGILLGYENHMHSFPTLEVLTAALAEGATTSQALVEDSIARSDSKAATDTFIVRLDAAARAEAKEADRRRAGGSAAPFTGIPITIKDNFDLKGLPTTAGSKILAFAVPAAADAPAVRKLREAGFVILGRTNMTEFAFSGLGLNPHYGTPLNPAFTDPRIPGGSSSGAAVSVALGIAPAAIGTDTGGSVRIPAALCGLVGFKPSADSVSRENVLPLSTTLDTVGVVAQTVADCRAVYGVMRTDRPTQAAAPTRRIGIVTNFVMNGVQPEVETAFTEAAQKLSAAGYEVTRIEVPIFNEIPEINKGGSIAMAEAFAWHQKHLPAAPDSAYDPRVISRIRPGGKITEAAFKVLLARRADIIAAFAQAAAGFDALAWPTVPVIAPTIKELALDDDYHRINGLILRNPTVINLADGCAISLPCPRPSLQRGPPVGFMLARPHGEDDTLLSVAAAVEKIFAA